jgi:carbon storage regulator
MLILSRRTNQRLVIGDNIEITVVELKDGHVRLGISAPKDVPVHRKELLDQIAAENIEAAASTSLPQLPEEACAAEQRPTQASLLERISISRKEGQ